MNQKLYLSVIVPVYNELNVLPTTFQALEGYFQTKGWQYEIIFVDDGSIDGSGDLLREFSHACGHVRVLENPVNMGKGFSIQRGVLEAHGEYVFFTDADLATPIEELDKFLLYLTEPVGSEVLVGSRRVPGSELVVKQPWYRRAMGEVFYQLVYFLLFKGVRDTNCGFKCFRRDVAKAVFQRQLTRGWAFDAETLFIAHRLGYDIREVPVRWAEPGTTKVRLFKASVVTFFDLLRIRWNDLQGRYL